VLAPQHGGETTGTDMKEEMTSLSR